MLFSQKWLYSGEMVVFHKGGCIRSKVVVFGKNGCTQAKWFYSGKSGSNRARWFLSGKVVVIGKRLLYWVKNSCTRAKVVVLGQKWL